MLALWRVTFAEFLPFIVLLLALYALGGGIAIKGGPWGRPAGNFLLLVIGTLLASVMGTIGAALLLIHPLLAANGHRYEKRHLVLAFIILVGNCGGALSPSAIRLCWSGFCAACLSSGRRSISGCHCWSWRSRSCCYVWGPTSISHAGKPGRSRKNCSIRGGLNIFLLIVLMVAIPLEGVWHPGNVTLLFTKIPGEHLAVMLLELACIALSEIFTPASIRSQNRFAWTAMREITILFFAIFATIAPVFAASAVRRPYRPARSPGSGHPGLPPPFWMQPRPI